MSDTSNVIPIPSSRRDSAVAPTNTPSSPKEGYSASYSTIDLIDRELAAYSRIDKALKGLPTQQRIQILGGCLGSNLCLIGDKPSRANALSGMGQAIDSAMHMIDLTYGDKSGKFR